MRLGGIIDGGIRRTCVRHPTYRAIRRPASDGCKACIALWEMAFVKAIGEAAQADTASKCCRSGCKNDVVYSEYFSARIPYLSEHVIGYCQEHGDEHIAFYEKLYDPQSFCCVPEVDSEGAR